jgi:hypothetical protein
LQINRALFFRQTLRSTGELVPTAVGATLVAMALAQQHLRDLLAAATADDTKVAATGAWKGGPHIHPRGCERRGPARGCRACDAVSLRLLPSARCPPRCVVTRGRAGLRDVIFVLIRDHEPQSAAAGAGAVASDPALKVVASEATAAVATPQLLLTEYTPCHGALALYLDASPEAVELFALWERAGVAATNRLAAACMKALACVVRYGYVAARRAVARRVLRTKLKSVLSAVAGSNPAATAAAQELCLAVVRLGGQWAREFVSRFNLAFKPFARHTADTNAIPTEFGAVRLRTGNVALVLSLLECGATDVLQEVLSSKGCVLSLLKGLHDDSDALVTRTLLAVEQRLVSNARISRKTKVDVFNAAAVEVRRRSHC